MSQPNDKAVAVRPNEAAFLPEMPTISAEMMEKALTIGDLSKMPPDIRVRYYLAVCKSANLNPLTRPFTPMKTQSGEVVLYANRDCAEQLRAQHRMSIKTLSREREGELYIVTVQGSLPNGRSEEAQGIVDVSTLKGQALANAYMKADTKAKRRVTMALCGLGFPMEDEAPAGAIPVRMDMQSGTLPQTERTLPRMAAETVALDIHIADLFGDEIDTMPKQAFQSPQDATLPLPSIPELSPRQDETPAILEPLGSPELPAGQAGATWVAQIEAAVIAGNGNLTAIWGWAEKKRKKPATQFSVNDLQWLLKEVRESKRQKGKHAALTPEPVVQETPMPVGEVLAQEDMHEPVDEETGEVLDDAPLSPVASGAPGDEEALWPPREDDPF